LTDPNTISPTRLAELNTRFAPLSPEDRIRALYAEFPREKVLFTSSFGTSAVILLHMFSRIEPLQQVHFIDTTYHFPETLAYRQQLTDLLGLQVVDVRPEEWKNKFTQEDQTWTKDPDFCCSINKVEPLDAIKPNFDVWVSGLMGHQNTQRQDRNVFGMGGDMLKFHPIIDMTEAEMNAYFKLHDLPEHPLQQSGYGSIGCVQCTINGQGRSGRWMGTNKSECGLHT
jgi:phosphoadenosine phosphosulfate reductase